MFCLVTIKYIIPQTFITLIKHGILVFKLFFVIPIVLTINWNIYILLFISLIEMQPLNIWQKYLTI